MPDDDAPAHTAPVAAAPARAAFDLLLKAAAECVRQGRLESAEEILEGAQGQVDDDPERQQGVDTLADEIAARRGRRRAGIDAAVAAIEAKLAEGLRMEADRLLFQAVEEHGEDPRFDELHEELHAVHRRDFEADVRSMIVRADEVSAEGDDAAAQELWLKAQALAPSADESLRTLLDTVGQQIARRTEEHRRLRVAEARRQIEDCIEALDYPGARAVVQALVSSLGSSEGAREVQQHLATTHEAVVNRRVREAGVAFEEGRYGTACNHLRSALVLSPDNPWLQERLREVEARMETAEAERQDDPRWRSLIETLEAQVEQGPLDAAAIALDEAEADWGEGGTLEDLRRRLRRRRRSLVEEQLNLARSARAQGDLLGARAAVATALEAAPDDPEAHHLETVVNRPPEEDSLPAAPSEVSGDVVEIEQLRASGQALEAWRRVQAAIERHGHLEPLPTLRRLIADEMLASGGV